MKLFVGLGNPGVSYAGNRHNIGFQCIDAFAAANNLTGWRNWAKALVSVGIIGGERVVLAKPQTFMNLSGEPVAELARFYKLEPADIVVVCDDLDLPLGRIRIRSEGGTGGHRGLSSIVERLGTNAFPRIRVGIGRPDVEGPAKKAAVHRYVLEDFSADELPTVVETRERVARALKTIITDSVEKAMNTFNR